MAAQIEAPQRGSTRSVYEAKWSIFTRWCLSNQVDFRAPSLKAIADFLLYLFQDRQLKPGTIDGCRSAIADKLGNSSINVSKDENLTYLLDSFHRDRPKGQSGIPSRNLSLVLHQLAKAPFEPLKEASLKHLTFKTVSTFWPWVQANAGVRSMLGYIRTSDTSQTGPLTQLSFQESAGQRGSSQCGPYVQSKPFIITWIGPQILSRTRSWYLSPSRKVLIKTSHLPLSPHGSSRV